MMQRPHIKDFSHNYKLSAAYNRSELLELFQMDVASAFYGYRKQAFHE